MTDKQVYDLTKYLFESWERGADYDNYHTDSMCVLEALAQPEMRPDEISTEELIYMAGLHDGKKQERPWVELTDAEIQKCYSAAYKVVQGRQLEVAFARAVGVKLKEKNYG